MDHQVVSRDQWIQERKQLLQKEKEFTRLRDELSKSRRELPWVQVDKEYRFEGTDGLVSLPDLFAGRSQLIVYHFMFGLDWEEGCPSCSFWADNFNSIVVHLNNRDKIFHTYSTYARGLDMLNVAYHYMDHQVVKGRDEASLPWQMAWLRRHDQYEQRNVT